MACLAKYLILSQDIFACYLVQSDIEYEVIDLLQDRVPKSVCARHYFNPSLEYRDKK
jgi:intergrase/recombinase